MNYTYEKCPANRECWWVRGPQSRPAHYGPVPEATIREVVAGLNGGAR